MPRHIVYVKEKKQEQPQQEASQFQAPPRVETPQLPPTMPQMMPKQAVSVFNQEQTINVTTIIYVLLGLAAIGGGYYLYKNRNKVKKNTLYF